MEVKTNKGTFRIRYSYSKIVPEKPEPVPMLVVNTGAALVGPFEGTHGDEIPFTKEAREKYQASIF